MDIHKPKPWHGFREFLKEYLIIVVGVLTALAGEQAVEWWHWRHVSEHTSQSLDAEVRSDLLYAADRLAVRDCLQGRLADLRDKLLVADGAWKADPAPHGAGAPPPGPHEADPGHVMRVAHPLPFFGYTHQAWDAARASGELSHLPRKRLEFYSAFYEEAERLNGWQADEQAAAVRLTPLAYDGRLDSAQRSALLADLAEVDNNAFYIDQFSRILLDMAGVQGLRPNPQEVARWVQDARAAQGDCAASPAPGG